MSPASASPVHGLRGAAATLTTGTPAAHAAQITGQAA